MVDAGHLDGACAELVLGEGVDVGDRLVSGGLGIAEGDSLSVEEAGFQSTGGEEPANLSRKLDLVALNVLDGRDAQLYEEVQAEVVTATRRSFRRPIHNSSCCSEFVRAGLLEHYSALLRKGFSNCQPARSRGSLS